jgi:hypothetical protein
MLTRFTARFIAVALLAALLIPAGCKSMDHHDDHGAGAGAAGASANMSCAIYCDKCQTTFTQAPVTASNPRGPYGVVGYRTVAKHECDECKKVAAEMIQQGKTMQPGQMVHKCKICGGEMRVCHQS